MPKLLKTSKMDLTRIKECILTTQKEKEFLNEVEQLRIFRTNTLLGTRFFMTESIISGECEKLSGIGFFSRLGAIKWAIVLVIFFLLALISMLGQEGVGFGVAFCTAGCLVGLVIMVLHPYNFNNYREFFLRRKSLTKTLFEQLYNQAALANEQIEKIIELEIKYDNPSKEDIVSAFPNEQVFLSEVDEQVVTMFWKHHKKSYLKDLAEQKDGWEKYKLCLDRERQLVMSL